ncbi:hypothetical protein Plhal304r1_c025g0085091 [Plasmopara halstedii]
MTFDLSLMRLVNQRQILRTLEFTLVGAGGDGRIPAPTREDLVRWLLTDAGKILHANNLFEQIEDQILPADVSLTIDRNREDLFNNPFKLRKILQKWDRRKNAKLSGPEMRQISRIRPKQLRSGIAWGSFD